MYNDKLINNESIIEHINKETYFCNVYLFIECVKKFVIVKSANLI